MSFFDENNSQFNTTRPMTRGFMSQVFGWMFAGLMTSAATAFYFSPAVNPALFKSLVSGPLTWLLLLQFGLVMFYSFKWQDLSFGTSVTLFLSYSGLTGITISPILYVYTGASLLQTFLVAATTFAVMALYGAITDHDLSQYSGLLTMGVFGLIIAMLINMFMKSGPANLVISAIGVLLFTVLTAYDVQKLKYLSTYSPDEPSMRGKLALMGALHLYLDLLNLFLFLLQLLGVRRR